MPNLSLGFFFFLVLFAKFYSYCSTLNLQNIPAIITDKPQFPEQSSHNTTWKSSGNDNGTSSSLPPFSPSTSSSHSLDSIISTNQNVPPSPNITRSVSPLSSPKISRAAHSPLPHVSSDSHLYGLLSPRQPPPSPKQRSSSMYDRPARGSSSYMEKSPSPSPTMSPFDTSPRSASFHSSHNLLSPYDVGSMGRRSPRPDRSPSPLSFNHPMSSTLPRNFMHRHSGKQRQFICLSIYILVSFCPLSSYLSSYFLCVCCE